MFLLIVLGVLIIFYLVNSSNSKDELRQEIAKLKERLDKLEGRTRESRNSGLVEKLENGLETVVPNLSKQEKPDPSYAGSSVAFSVEDDGKNLSLPPGEWLKTKISNNGTPPPQEPAGLESFESFTGVKLFAWVGGFALFLGVAFFLKYAIDIGLLTPAVRVAGGALFGISAIIAGLQIKDDRYRVTSHTLSAAGVAILYVTIFAAAKFYGFIGHATAFMSMAVVSGVSFWLAVNLNAKYVALLGLIGGFLTPPLMSTGVDHALALFGYIAILDASLLFMALEMRWKFVAVLSAIGTILTQAGWYVSFFTSDKLLEVNLIFLSSALLYAAFAYFVAEESEDNSVFSQLAALVTFVPIIYVFSFCYCSEYAGFPFKVFSVALIMSLLLAAQSGRNNSVSAWQVGAGLMTCLALWLWPPGKMTLAILPQTLALYVIFGLLNSLLPLVARKDVDVRRLAWLSLYPLALFVPLLSGVTQTGAGSYLVWPVVFLLLAFLLLIGVVTWALWVVCAAIIGFLVTGFVWLFAVPPLPEEIPYLLVLFCLGAVFFGAFGLLLPTLAKKGVGIEPEKAAFYREVPAVGVLAPFLLLMTVAARFHPMPPNFLFLAAIVLMTLTAFFALLSRMDWAMPLALLGTFLAALTWHLSSFNSVAPLTPCAWYILLFAVFWTVPLLFSKRTENMNNTWGASALSGVLCFVLLYMAVTAIFHTNKVGWLPAMFAVAYVPLAIASGRMGGTPESIRARLALFWGIALFFFTLIFPIQLDRDWLLIAWVLEGAALVWLYRHIQHHGLKKSGYFLLCLCAADIVLRTLFTALPRQEGAFFNWHLYNYGITAAASIYAGWRWRPTDEKMLGYSAAGILQSIGVVLLFLWMNVAINNYFAAGRVWVFDFTIGFACSMAYTLGWGCFASVLFGAAVKLKQPLARIAGVVLMSAAVLKLFFYDLWSMGQLYRVGAFVGLAGLLIAISSSYQKILALDGKQREEKRHGH